jgi:DNA-binding Lrp family transcriptional regulator
LSADSLEDKALELIKSHQSGVLQSELWKGLNIDSRKCSRVIAKLEAEGKIKRTWETIKGTRTYRISYLPQKKETPKRAVNFNLILAGTEVAPCIGCTYECEPDYCPDLGNWVELLAKSPPPEPEEVEEEPEVLAQVEEAPEVAVEEEKVAPKGKKSGKPVKAVKPVKEEKPAKETKPAKTAKAEIPEKAAPKAKSTKPAKEEKKPLKAAKSSKTGKK